VSVKQWRTVLSSHTFEIPTGADWSPDHFHAMVPLQQADAVGNGRSSLQLSTATWKQLSTVVEGEKPVTCSRKITVGALV